MSALRLSSLPSRLCPWRSSYVLMILPHHAASSAWRGRPPDLEKRDYMCLPSGSGFAWVFIGPQATLCNDAERQIITHFLSPNSEEGDTARATWQHSRDTSMVWAKQIASHPKSNEAIPWLLLEVVGADFGPTGGDRLTKTTYIQRVHTSGGLAPTTGCTQAFEARTRAFVPYTADYIFYKASERE
jgi:hypothetical protein